jgi:spore coat protein CotH
MGIRQGAAAAAACGAALTLIGCGPRVTADEPVFDPDVVASYRLTFEEADWEAVLSDGFDQFECGDRVYARARLEYDNPMSGAREVYEDVGVRYRGHNIYLDSGVERRGFKLGFDTFVDGREFHGLRKVNLLGTEGDYTLLRERLATGVLRGLGGVAPRVNHAELYVNGRYMGLFPNSEEADDDPFLEQHFGDDSGSLYKVKGYCGFRADLAWVGEDPEAYVSTYEPKADTVPEDMRADLIPFLACASADEAAFRDCIEDWIDVEAWLREIAVDVVLPDVDGLAGAGQNFLLYARPSDGRFVVYPWDKDLSFYLTTLADSSTGIFAVQPAWLENSTPQLVDRLRTTFRGDFCAQVLAVAERTDPDVLGVTIDALEDALAPFVRRDPFLDPAQWRYNLDDIRSSLSARHPQVLREATECAE